MAGESSDLGSCGHVGERAMVACTGAPPHPQGHRVEKGEQMKENFRRPDQEALGAKGMEVERHEPLLGQPRRRHCGALRWRHRRGSRAWGRKAMTGWIDTLVPSQWRGPRGGWHGVGSAERRDGHCLQGHGAQGRVVSQVHLRKPQESRMLEGKG